MIQALLISSERTGKYGKQKAKNHPLDIYIYIKYIYINFFLIFWKVNFVLSWSLTYWRQDRKGSWPFLSPMVFYLLPDASAEQEGRCETPLCVTRGPAKTWRIPHHLKEAEILHRYLFHKARLYFSLAYPSQKDGYFFFHLEGEKLGAKNK